jgi:isopropylmalate/homocitrate/citramalate synthase
MFPVLVPNIKGLDAAIGSGATEIAIFGSASEQFSHKNINCSIAESLARFREVCDLALAKGIRVRGYNTSKYMTDIGIFHALLHVLMMDLLLPRMFSKSH